MQTWQLPTQTRDILLRRHRASAKIRGSSGLRPSLHGLVGRRTADQVDLATAAWVAWWNAERLHSACGDVPPAEFEAAYHHRLQATEAA
jgi:transposase InsO family protein